MLPIPTTLVVASLGMFSATCIASAQHAPARVHNAQAQEANQEIENDDQIKQIDDALDKLEKESPDGELRLPGSKAKAEPGELTIGDKAPKPVIAKVFKGDTDFNGFEPGKIYIMEFWATWCGPCKAGMPHLTELQKQYADKGVEIIGCAIWQREKTQKERETTVQNFLAQPEWAKKTGYTVAIDKESNTSDAYMKASGQSGIPCAFIVGKDGYVEWIGHPMTMDEPLAKVVAGDWNRTAYKETFAREQAQKKKDRALRRELFTAQRSGDNQKVLAILDRELKEDPDNLNYLMQKFELMVGPMNDEQGYEVGWKILKQNRNNSQILNAISWYTLDDPAVEDRDLEFAMAAAKAANEASGGNDAAVLDTLARAYFETGDLNRAIKFQKKAVENAGDNRMSDDIRKTLKKYEDAAQAKTT